MILFTYVVCFLWLQVLYFRLNRFFTFFVIPSIKNSIMHTCFNIFAACNSYFSFTAFWYFLKFGFTKVSYPFVNFLYFYFLWSVLLVASFFFYIHYHILLAVALLLLVGVLSLCISILCLLKFSDIISNVLPLLNLLCCCFCCFNLLCP